jgi:hypothetical protein
MATLPASESACNAGTFHLLDETDIHTIEEANRKHRMIATSETADIYLIRSHIAYYCGRPEASRCTIKPSRGHSYRVRNLFSSDWVVRITDHLDYRHGVEGIV